MSSRGSPSSAPSSGRAASSRPRARSSSSPAQTASRPPSRRTGSPNDGSATWADCAPSTWAEQPTSIATVAQRPPRGPVRSVALRVDVVRPVLELGALVLVVNVAVTMKLFGQRPEVRLIGAVLQVAGDLRLLRLGSA